MDSTLLQRGEQGQEHILSDRANALEKQIIIMEVQEEIISSWQVQDGVLHLAAFHQKRMRQHSRTPRQSVPRRGTLWEGGGPTCTV